SRSGGACRARPHRACALHHILIGGPARPASRLLVEAPQVLGRSSAPSSLPASGSTVDLGGGGARPGLKGNLAVGLSKDGQGGFGFIWALQPSFRLTLLQRPPMSGMFSRTQVRRVLQRVPGKQRFGVYRFLPFFFVLGGTMEWIMIKLRVGQETFYDVYRRKASERQYQRRLQDASETELQQSIKRTD
uniref:Uncharacterized protein n=1 Tax=Ovis aries TaxID=9940 RepID=A0AC11EU41_SHEEP